MKWYYLAFLIHILRGLMVLTIVLIPVLMYLIDRYEWWEKPFETAYFR